MKTSPQQKTIRVAIVDDHTMMREGWRLFIENAHDLTFAWMAGDASEAMRRVDQDTPDVLVVDISLPDRSGLELIKDLRLLRPKLPMIAVSMHDEKLYAQRALKAGARGYVMKSAPQKVLENALHRVAGGGIAVSEEMSEEILRAFSSGTANETKDSITELSDREFEVFRLMGQGRNTGQIAETLRISTKTVDVHKMNIRAKLGINGSSELAYFAIRWTEGQVAGS
ncbi:response regulator transcription factor [Prosthecobacter sp.]|uniref:response regulator transcription factor n=1 Tax=Prosthecobacter sp. TaxID=1965333 RepID=UPI001D681709|nr:response regulator transcription factor [Prosthecobacter sp.]MCB1277099.1 response regulator transcription factor [Prosthecobacter sp.]